MSGGWWAVSGGCLVPRASCPSPSVYPYSYLQVLHKEEEVHVSVQDDLEVHRHDLSIFELDGRALTYGHPLRIHIRGATQAPGATTPTRNHHPNATFPRPGAVRLMKVLPGGWQMAQLQRTP